MQLVAAWGLKCHNVCWDVHLLVCSVSGDQSILLIPPMGQSNAPAPRSWCVKAKPRSTRPGGFPLVLSPRLGNHPQTALLQLRAVSSLCVGFPLCFWFGALGCLFGSLCKSPSLDARGLPGRLALPGGCPVARAGKGEPGEEGGSPEQAGSGCGRGCGDVGEPWGHFAALPGTDAAVSTGPSLARRQHLGCWCRWQ